MYLYLYLYYWVVEAGDETDTWDNSKFDKLGNLKQPNEQLFVDVDVDVAVELEVHDDSAKDAKPCCL